MANTPPESPLARPSGAAVSSLESFLGWYTQLTRQSAEAALSNLNGSVNWALTITLGIAAFVTQFILGSDRLEPTDALFTLGILTITLSIIVHFAIRTAKNYINLVRFAALERAALRTQASHLLNSTSAPDAGDSLSRLLVTIRRYHISWISPISKKKILWKVLFEFGFVYFLLFLSVAFWYVNTLVPSEKSPVVYLFIALYLMSVLIELIIFRNTPYVRSVSVDTTAERLG